MPECLIAMGSNLGDRQANIAQAITSLTAHPKIRLLASSSLHVTAPVGGPANQPDFLNAAIRIETPLAPRALLELLQKTEADLGRTRDVHWGPRTIDLDLLLYADQPIDEPGLKVPHPLLHERRFVLAPAVEVAPNMVHPILHRTIAELLSDLDSTSPSA